MEDLIINNVECDIFVQLLFIFLMKLNVHHEKLIQIDSKFKNLLTFKQLLSIIIHLVLKLIIFIVISIILYKTIKNAVYQSAVNKIRFKINNISQIETSKLTQEINTSAGAQYLEIEEI